ncbi:MAG: tetratricopeptide repeat protein, partial [Propionibacteriaceae bacterium]|nr:tetratricopeptide repeat protein [Propionibacteriaceae bacterium]
RRDDRGGRFEQRGAGGGRGGDRRFDRRGDGDRRFARGGAGGQRFDRRDDRDRDWDADDRPKVVDPPLPPDLELNLADLPRAMKAELRGLPNEIGDKVGLRLMAAGRLLEEDPAAAYEQVKVARRLAARLPIVRAAVAETAYAAGDYQAALTDYRTLRRMSGEDEYLPVMADCERALGRPEEALRLARESQAAKLEPASAVEMVMVEAGARADLGQHAEALRLLERMIRQTQRIRINDTSKARLRYAYADLLLATGDAEQAREWFAAAAKLDADGVTDADERVAELDGVVIDFDETEDWDEANEDGEAQAATDSEGEQLVSDETQSIDSEATEVAPVEDAGDEVEREVVASDDADPADEAEKQP